MTKHINPFYTIGEAVSVLKNLGAKPTSNPFKYNESDIIWPEHILSVCTRRVYDEHCDYYFETEIHIDKEGLDAFVEMTGLTILREYHSDGYDLLYVRPGSLLKVFTLEAKGATQS